MTHLSRLSCPQAKKRAAESIISLSQLHLAYLRTTGDVVRNLRAAIGSRMTTKTAQDKWASGVDKQRVTLARRREKIVTSCLSFATGGKTLLVFSRKRHRHWHLHDIRKPNQRQKSQISNCKPPNTTIAARRERRNGRRAGARLSSARETASPQRYDRKADAINSTRMRFPMQRMHKLWKNCSAARIDVQKDKRTNGGGGQTGRSTRRPSCPRFRRSRNCHLPSEFRIIFTRYE